MFACAARDSDERTIEKFEKVLRQQYVIETCEAGHPARHVWNFQGWYEQRCMALATITEWAFRGGMLSILGSIMTFEVSTSARRA